MNGNIGNTGDMGEMISKMLSDPETLGRVMNMASALSASGAMGGFSIGNEKEKIPSEEETKKGDAMPHGETHGQSAPVHREVSSRPHIRPCDRIRLLEAMRPFLGEDKREKLDVVIKLLGLAEAAGGLYSFKR